MSNTSKWVLTIVGAFFFGSIIGLVWSTNKLSKRVSALEAK